MHHSTPSESGLGVCFSLWLYVGTLIVCMNSGNLYECWWCWDARSFAGTQDAHSEKSDACWQTIRALHRSAFKAFAVMASANSPGPSPDVSIDIGPVSAPVPSPAPNSTEPIAAPSPSPELGLWWAIKSSSHANDASKFSPCEWGSHGRNGAKLCANGLASCT